MPISRRTALAALTALGGLPSLAAQEPERLRVAAIYTVPFEQQWASRIHLALQTAQTRGDIHYQASENVTNADYERVMREYAQAGYQLIFGEVFGVETVARRVAQDFPQTAFVMGSSGQPQAPNFSVFDNYIQEPAYLTGMIAGGMSQSGRIGLVGGFPIPEVNRLMNAFIDGVRAINPNASFSISFINSWFAPPKAKEAALAMIDAGADILYAERFGVSDAASERQVLAIGNVVDTQDQYPDTVVASALWNMQPTVDEAIRLVRAGSYQAEDYGRWSMMPAGGASLAPLGRFADRVPAAIQQQVSSTQADILAGRFSVRVNDRQPQP